MVFSTGLCIYYLLISCSHHSTIIQSMSKIITCFLDRDVHFSYFLFDYLFFSREISRAAGKTVTGIIDDESSGNNAQ